MITENTVYFMIVNQNGTEANVAPADNTNLALCISIADNLQAKAAAHMRYSVLRVATVYTAKG